MPPRTSSIVTEEGPALDEETTLQVPEAAEHGLEPGTWPPALRRFAFFRLVDSAIDQVDPADRGRLAWEHVLDGLAHLAEPEDWAGSSADGRHLPILDSYLRYTYQRLVIEQKIAVTADGQYAALNTGLLTPYAEAIFGLFQRNRREDLQPWFFLRWASESDRDILRHFPSPPDLAEYVSDPADLVYDWRRRLMPAYDHILTDNIDRFPADLSTHPVRAKQALDAAIEWAVKRARRNYKVIVPQWYPKLGEAGAQFLLPLDLTGEPGADLALVVSAVGKFYRGHTVLTLDMAYTNARLVARPDSEWLKPTPLPLRLMDEGDEDGESTSSRPR